MTEASPSHPVLTHTTTFIQNTIQEATYITMARARDR